MDSWGGVPLILLGVVLLAALGVAVFLFVKLLRMGRVARSTNMPQQGKIAFWIGLAYSVSPLDLLPDPVYLDDIGVLVGALTYLGHLARKHGLIGTRPVQSQVEDRPGRPSREPK